MSFFFKYFVNLLEIAEIASLAIDGSEMVQIFFFFFFFLVLVFVSCIILWQLNFI